VVCRELKCYPFGMEMPGREYSSGSGYRYGFNGKEKDDEVMGEGNEIDYGMRVYDTRIGRFLSMDPLLEKFPMLTPYQYASNTPIQAIDIDGTEGTKYEVLYEENGQTKIKTVVDVDVYVGVSKTNPSFYQVADVPTIKSGLEKEYNQGFKVDDQLVEFNFNVKTFDVDVQSVDDFSKNLQKTSSVETDELQFIDANTKLPVYRKSITGVAIATKITPAGTSEQGGTLVNRVTINSTASDKRHTESHELGHFFLLGSPKNPSTAKTHNAMGGIFTYKTVDEEGNVIQDVQGMNLSNIKEFIKNIPTKKSPAPTTVGSIVKLTSTPNVTAPSPPAPMRLSIPKKNEAKKK